MGDIYNDSTYLSKNPTWGAEDSAFKASHIHDLLKRNPISVKTICEVGCGSGEVLIQLNNKLGSGYRFYGFDISKDAMSIAKKKETENISFELKDITAKDDSSSFDLILVLDVIEHVENYFEFVRCISKKSKYTTFQIPLDMSVWTLFREKILLESKDRVGHIHNFTEDFIISVLHDNGFKVIDRTYLPPIFECTTLKQKFVRLLHRMLFWMDPRFCSKFMGSCTLNLLMENTPKHE